MLLDAENLLRPIPISTRDHTTSGLAVFPLSPELPRCRSLLSQCGFSIDDTLLQSYAFMYPFSPEVRRYISGNASTCLTSAPLGQIGLIE
jgi:hypothetical protein